MGIKAAIEKKTLGIDIENFSTAEKRPVNVSGGVSMKKIGTGTIVRETGMRKGFIITQINGKAVMDS